MRAHIKLQEIEFYLSARVPYKRYIINGLKEDREISKCKNGFSNLVRVHETLAFCCCCNAMQHKHQGAATQCATLKRTSFLCSTQSTHVIGTLSLLVQCTVFNLIV